jgi:hypothetical protein
MLWDNFQLHAGSPFLVLLPGFQKGTDIKESKEKGSSSFGQKRVFCVVGKENF